MKKKNYMIDNYIKRLIKILNVTFYLLVWTVSGRTRASDHRIQNPTKQTEVLAQWPITKSLLLFGKWQRDLELNYSNDILFGFEYSNCCLKWGLMHRKWLEEDYFSWRHEYSSPFGALTQGFNPSKERDRTYLFFELNQTF